MKPYEFELVLVDPQKGLYDAWKEQFTNIKNVSVVHGVFEKVSEYDCMVSPANSFGIMDGGVDRAIIEYFGIELMDRVQEHIIKNYRGEQPVGTSFIIETGDPKHAFLAHTPTMRIPMDISDTDNVYLAMAAMLLAVWQHNLHSDKKISIVLCPGLGTATGRVPFSKAAKAMSLAYRNFLDPPHAISWPYAVARHNAIKGF